MRFIVVELAKNTEKYLSSAEVEALRDVLN